MIEADDSPVFHNNEPEALVDKVDVPLQLFTTVITGVAGADLGAAVAVAGILLHPSTVAITVYAPAVVTVISAVASFVLHRKEPIPVAVNVEVPLQLLATNIPGIAGVDLGAAMPDPVPLVHPFIVDVTVYVPALVTVIDEVDSPVFQSNDPVALVERTEVPSQLSTTVTTGVDGVDLGDATPEPASLVQPFTVAVTV